MIASASQCNASASVLRIASSSGALSLRSIDREPRASRNVATPALRVRAVGASGAKRRLFIVRAYVLRDRTFVEPCDLLRQGRLDQFLRLLGEMAVDAAKMNACLWRPAPA